MAGAVVLPRFKKPGETLLRLLFEESPDASTFKKYLRSFNNAVCFSSLVFNERKFSGNYKPTVVIEGRVHQYFGPLMEKDHETPRFAQLWVHDPAMETTRRIANMSLPASTTKTEEESITRIITMLQVRMQN